MKAEMYAIVAVDECMGIGRDNDMLFSIPDDMKYFRKTTLGSTVILGRKNLLSFPGHKPLPKRRNIVLSRTMEEGEGYEVCRGVEELFELLNRTENGDKVFVIGGGEVYSLLLPYCSKAYVTVMHRDFGGEVFFPDVNNLPGWSLAEEGEELDYEGLKYSFNIYENSNVKKF